MGNTKEDLCLMATNSGTSKGRTWQVRPMQGRIAVWLMGTTWSVALSSVQSSEVTQSCPTLCDPMDCSTPSFPVHHQLPELAQTHLHRVADTTQPSHLPLSPSPPAFNLSQHQGLLSGISSSHQVVKVLQFQLQHQSFQWIFRTDFL